MVNWTHYRLVVPCTFAWDYKSIMRFWNRHRKNETTGERFSSVSLRLSSFSLKEVSLSRSRWDIWIREKRQLSGSSGADFKVWPLSPRTHKEVGLWWCWTWYFVLYPSKTICDEFIQLMATQVEAHIVKEIKAAKYYAISVDSTPDIGHADQLFHCSPCACYQTASQLNGFYDL